jgi:hypothetical protein
MPDRCQQWRDLVASLQRQLKQQRADLQRDREAGLDTLRKLREILSTEASLVQAQSRLRVCLAVAVAPLMRNPRLFPPRRVDWVAGSSAKVRQLSGERDNQLDVFTDSRTETNYGIIGSDLGASFTHNGRIYFLFGDVYPVHEDPVRFLFSKTFAWVPATADPEATMPLNYLASGGQYLPPTVPASGPDPAVSLGNFEVPTGGFSALGLPFVLFATDHGVNVQGRSVLAWSTTGSDLVYDQHYTLSVLADGGRFINVSPVVVDETQWPGLPSPGGGVLFFGSADYRTSDLYLAYCPLAQLTDRTKAGFRYFAGLEAGSRSPIWSAHEFDAMPLFYDGGVGELSVHHNPLLDKWIALYSNGPAPNEILWRSADNPWGPWSSSGVLFDGNRDGGYCHFQYATWCNDQQLATPGRDFTGGAYGPFVVEAFHRGAPDNCTLYYTMSPANPYQVMLLKSTLTAAPAALPRPWIGNVALIQSRFGSQGNLEVAAPLAAGGFAHLWRNDNFGATPPWSPAHPFSAATAVDAVSLIESNLGDAPGELDLVARSGDGLHFSNRATRTGDFSPLAPIVADGAAVSGAAGNPVLIQGPFGSPGNFELVVPSAGGGFLHLWRENGAAGQPWHGPIPVGSGAVDAVAAIVSNQVQPGELIVVSRSGDRLLTWRRETYPSFQWHGPEPLVADGRAVAGVAGVPSLVQSRFGANGNYELVVPSAGGGLLHFWRDNDAPGTPWHGPGAFAAGVSASAVSLFAGNYANNLELLALSDGRLWHFWRDSGALAWHGPYELPVLDQP